jgi:hypothetical protein
MLAAPTVADTVSRRAPFGDFDGRRLRLAGRRQGCLKDDAVLVAAWSYVSHLPCGSMILKTSPTEDVPSMSVMRDICMAALKASMVIQRLSKLAVAGHVAGIDQSREMVEQARARNATAIQSGRVDLGTVPW